VWPLCSLRLKSCCTVAITGINTCTVPDASTIAVSGPNSDSRAESCAVTNPDANTASSIHADRSGARRRNAHSNRWRGSGGFSWRQHRSRHQDRLRRNLSSGRVDRGCNDHAGVRGRLCVADSCRSGVEGRNRQLRSRQVIRRGGTMIWLSQLERARQFAFTSGISVEGKAARRILDRRAPDQ